MCAVRLFATSSGCDSFGMLLYLGVGKMTFINDSADRDDFNYRNNARCIGVKMWSCCVLFNDGPLHIMHD